MNQAELLSQLQQTVFLKASESRFEGQQNHHLSSLKLIPSKESINRAQEVARQSVMLFLSVSVAGWINKGDYTKAERCKKKSEKEMGAVMKSVLPFQFEKSLPGSVTQSQITPAELPEVERRTRQRGAFIFKPHLIFQLRFLLFSGYIP